MPNLGDYLGHLMSEITIARMKGNIESIRIAELYSAHPLLRNMPIPHFRLPSIELDVPVVIKQMEEEQAGELPRGTPPLAAIRKTFERVFDTTIREEGLSFKPEVNTKLRATLDKKWISLSRPKEISIDVNRVADEMSSTTSRLIIEAGTSMDKQRQQKFEEKLRETTRLEFIKLRKPPTRLQVLVTTGEIREAGPNEIVTKLHLKITEESFEWTTIESEGGKHDKLVVE